MSLAPPLPAAPGAASRTDWWLYCRWVLATALGELVGFLAPAIAGVVMTRVVIGMEGWLAPLLTLIVVVAAGSLEGAALGYAQWLVLRRALPAIGWRQWTGATALAGVLAWVLGMTPNTLVDALGLGSGALLLAWLMAAPGILLSIGTAQWLVLRRHVARAGLWIPANIAGWILGLAATFGGASLISETMPIALAVAIGVASGVLMGIVVGLVTGLALLALVRRRLAAD